MISATPFGGSFFQLGYVARDLDAAVKLFAARYSVPEFLIMDTRVIPGWEGPHVRAGMAYRGDTMIEIIEPLTEPNIYAEALPNGAGVNLHHLAYYIPTRDWAALPAAIAAHGYSIAFQTPPALPLQVIYIDARRDLGHYLEFVHANDAVAQLFAPILRYDDGR